MVQLHAMLLPLSFGLFSKTMNTRVLFLIHLIYTHKLHLPNIADFSINAFGAGARVCHPLLQLAVLLC